MTEPSPTALTRPVPRGSARIDALDALRGFALIGILLVNIPPLADMPPTVGDWQGSTQQWLDVLVQQRFFPLFSFLFGLSTALFLDRAAARTDRPRLVLLRRLLALAVIGLAHQMLHPGEALLPYAIVGLVVLLPATWLPRPVIALGGVAATALAVTLFSGGTLLIPGLFLLGLAAARYGLPAQLARPARWRWAAVLVVAVLVAVPLVGLQMDDIVNSGFNQVSAVAGLALALAYAAALVLLLAGPAGPALSAVLAPLGRLSLTNYLSATLLVLAAVPLLGLSGSDRYGTAIALAAVVVAVQIVVSRWWLGRFRYGPAEWVWRTVTWWGPAPMRRERWQPGAGTG
ncbi:DUF418 domain-containing protein [Pseudonocardia sp. HH130630-07]|uniref:DUF418 domain-containing protein n=1 Tax=Pseudonocardia sp. HH130630-07 TaxID=1690815 RepID=UPI000814C096|nr:DUF418 domain-containing protein [Pseudonocardia sp. HH130630-07]ANY06091.1 hypothetical protein AFB00_07020 [Pseudonocardia sp. HH130630-07]